MPLDQAQQIDQRIEDWQGELENLSTANRKRIAKTLSGSLSGTLRDLRSAYGKFATGEGVSNAYTIQSQTARFNELVRAADGLISDAAIKAIKQTYKDDVNDAYELGGNTANDLARVIGDKNAAASKLAAMPVAAQAMAGHRLESFWSKEAAALREKVTSATLGALQRGKGWRGAQKDIASALRSSGQTIIKGNDELSRTARGGIVMNLQERADLIARTELANAFIQGQISQYRKNGYTYGRWSAAGERTCPFCASREGVIYTLDDLESAIPAHPRCRCTASPVEGDAVKKVQSAGDKEAAATEELQDVAWTKIREKRIKEFLQFSGKKSLDTGAYLRTPTSRERFLKGKSAKASEPAWMPGGRAQPDIKAASEAAKRADIEAKKPVVREPTPTGKKTTTNVDYKYDDHTKLGFEKKTELTRAAKAVNDYVKDGYDPIRAVQAQKAIDAGRPVTNYEKGTAREFIREEGRSGMAKWAKKADIIEDFIRRAPKYKGEVSRGVNFRFDDQVDKFIDQLKTGNPSTTIESWTNNASHAAKFAAGQTNAFKGDAGVIMKVVNKDGAPINSLNPSGEGEVLMPSNVRFKVKEVKRNVRKMNGVNITEITLEAVSDKPAAAVKKPATAKPKLTAEEKIVSDVMGDKRFKSDAQRVREMKVQLRRAGLNPDQDFVDLAAKARAKGGDSAATEKAAEAKKAAETAAAAKAADKKAAEKAAADKKAAEKAAAEKALLEKLRAQKAAAEKAAKAKAEAEKAAKAKARAEQKKIDDERKARDEQQKIANQATDKKAAALGKKYGLDATATKDLLLLARKAARLQGGNADEIWDAMAGEMSKALKAASKTAKSDKVDMSRQYAGPKSVKLSESMIDDAFKAHREMEGLSGENFRKLERFINKHDIVIIPTNPSRNSQSYSRVSREKLVEDWADISNNENFTRAYMKNKTYWGGETAIKNGRARNYRRNFEAFQEAAESTSEYGGRTFMTGGKTKALGFTGGGSSSVQIADSALYKKIGVKEIAQLKADVADGFERMKNNWKLPHHASGDLKPGEKKGALGQRAHNWMSTLIHETGHQVHFRGGTKAMNGGHIEYHESPFATDGTKKFRPGEDYAPSRYGSGNRFESFAEAMVQYVYQPEMLKIQSPEAYKWIDEHFERALADE